MPTSNTFSLTDIELLESIVKHYSLRLYFSPFSLFSVSSGLPRVLLSSLSPGPGLYSSVPSLPQGLAIHPRDIENVLFQHEGWVSLPVIFHVWFCWENYGGVTDFCILRQFGINSTPPFPELYMYM